MKLLALLLCSSLAFLCYSVTPAHFASAQSFPPASYHPFEVSIFLDGKGYYLRGNATEGIDVKTFTLIPDVGMEISLNSRNNDTGEIVLLLPKSMIDNITSADRRA